MTTSAARSAEVRRSSMSTWRRKNASLRVR
jgi:hypothetical protein